MCTDDKIIGLIMASPRRISAGAICYPNNDEVDIAANLLADSIANLFSGPASTVPDNRTSHPMLSPDRPDHERLKAVPRWIAGLLGSRAGRMPPDRRD